MNPNFQRPARALLLAVMIAASPGASAQTLDQVIVLQPGWNAVHLEVEPAANSPAEVFASLPIESVWTYTDRTSPVEFIRNQTELPWNNPGWRRYFPPASESAVLNNLFSIHANTAYLIQLSGAVPVTWTLTGRPSFQPIQWVPDSFNLRGFPVEPADPPTFEEYFQTSPAHAGQPAYRLQGSGVWELVAGTDRMRSGEAVWIYTRGASDFTAPFRLKLDGGDGLDYDLVLNTLNLRVQSALEGPVLLEITDRSGAANPFSVGEMSLAGEIRWEPLGARRTREITAGRESIVRLAVQRVAMTSARYQSILEISDGSGTRYLLPVDVRRQTAADAGSSSSLPRRAGRFSLQSRIGRHTEASDEAREHAGLWMGSAIINSVSESQAASYTTQLTTAGGAASSKARTVISFEGANNDIEIEALEPGEEFNHLTVELRSNGLVQGNLAVAGFEGTGLVVQMENGVTTAAKVIEALNALTEQSFNTRYVARSANSEGSTGILSEAMPPTMPFLRTASTGGGASSSAATVTFSFPGLNNDLQLAATAAGTDGNGLTVTFKSAPQLPAAQAAAAYDPATRTLQISFRNNLTTAATIIDAVNGLDAVGFTGDYAMSSANAEDATGAIGGFSETAITSGGSDGTPSTGVFVFSGPDNDIEIFSRANDPSHDGLDIRLKSDGTVTGSTALARFSGGVLLIDVNRGVTTAATVIAALNALTEDTFNTRYGARAANDEVSSGTVAETTPTGSSFELRLLIHVDADGNAKLLKEVVQMWKDGNYLTITEPNPDNLTQTVSLLTPDAGNPGRFVLLTDDTLIPDYKGAGLRGGQIVGRRLSSVGIDFEGRELAMTGGHFAMESGLAATIQIPQDFGTNPFLHRRHPDHSTTNGFNLTRTIELQFTPALPAGAPGSSLNYGESQIGGHYRERFVGLHRAELIARGVFVLQRIALTDRLNGQ